MRIAFHAPLKSPDHAVPSGDRQMARMLMTALRLAGFRVDVVSQLRSHMPDAETENAAALETARIAESWRGGDRPDLWFCYHPYYKAPDLLGPGLCQAFDVPYVTAEASYSKRRDAGIWGVWQSRVVEAVGMAKVNICFTGRDREGLLAGASGARTEMLPPFIDTEPYASLVPQFQSTRLVSVAMMRKGDKFDSYQFLSKALALLVDLPWTLEVIGNGPLRAEATALFSGLPVKWLGEISPDKVPDALGAGGIYVWPGCGEAYGLAYLEAQAAGLPVVAQDIAGVPEVVRGGETGFLTPAGDVQAYADAIRRLLIDASLQSRMAVAARAFVLGERSLTLASQRLAGVLHD